MLAPTPIGAFVIKPLVDGGSLDLGGKRLITLPVSLRSALNQRRDDCCTLRRACLESVV